MSERGGREGDEVLSDQGKETDSKKTEMHFRFLERTASRPSRYHVLLRADGVGVHPPFLRWLVRGPDWWEQVATFNNVGAVFDSLRCADVPNFRLPVPPLPEQRAIASILNSVDDKIELNRGTSETLEMIARVLFKSWFVDFEPVRARAEGRELRGINAATASLFPSEFEPSALGEVPKGWRSSALREWASVLSGGTPSKSDPSLWDGEIPWISPKVMTAIHADVAEALVTQKAIGNGTRMAPAGATLVMVRGMGLHHEVRVSQARRPVAFNQDVKALVPNEIDPNLLLFALLDGQAELLTRVESSGHGTGRLPSDILLGHVVTMPPPDDQRGLAAVFDGLNRRIEIAREESRSLSELRDSLLPRLLSGDLAIGDASRFLEAKPA